ncbi:MAG: YciI family protein [Archangium sp.]
MKYMVLIYGSEAAAAKVSEADLQAELAAYFAYNDLLKKEKAYIAGEALQPVSTATTVRVRNGKAQHTDGPFAETKEQLGGFYFIEAPNLEKALELGAKCPGAKVGSVEVRAIVDFGPMENK